MLSVQKQRQSQVQNQDVINKQQSLILLKNMMRIGISSVCFMRELFPGNCFETVKYGSTTIHQMKSAVPDPVTKELIILNEDAFLLTQWLERGVFSALNKEYLRCMTFTIFTKHPIYSTDLPLESYEFKISYGRESSTYATINGAPLKNKDDLKSQASKFVRSLVEFTGTLQDLPDDRWITITLSYNDTAPDNFEPEYFCPGDISCFKFVGNPIKVKVGGLKTTHQEMNLRFVGLEALTEEDLRFLPLSCDSTACAANTSNSLGGTTSASSIASSKVFNGSNLNNLKLAPSSVNSKAVSKVTTFSSEFEAPTVTEHNISSTNTVSSSLRLFHGDDHMKNHHMNKQSREKLFNQGTNEDLTMSLASIKIQQPLTKIQIDVDSSTRGTKSLTSVRDFILEHGTTNIRACANNLGITEAVVQSAFDHMLRDGLILKKGRSYTVANPESSPHLPPIAPCMSSTTAGSSAKKGALPIVSEYNTGDHQPHKKSRENSIPLTQPSPTPNYNYTNTSVPRPHSQEFFGTTDGAQPYLTALSPAPKKDPVNPLMASASSHYPFTPTAPIVASSSHNQSLAATPTLTLISQEGGQASHLLSQASTTAQSNDRNTGSDDETTNGDDDTQIRFYTGIAQSLSAIHGTSPTTKIYNCQPQQQALPCQVIIHTPVTSNPNKDQKLQLIKAPDTVSLSQESETSVSSSKRRRVDSVIKDPILLSHRRDSGRDLNQYRATAKNRSMTMDVDSNSNTEKTSYNIISADTRQKAHSVLTTTAGSFHSHSCCDQERARSGQVDSLINGTANCQNCHINNTSNALRQQEQLRGVALKNASANVSLSAHDAKRNL